MILGTDSGAQGHNAASTGNEAAFFLSVQGGQAGKSRDWAGLKNRPSRQEEQSQVRQRQTRSELCSPGKSGVAMLYRTPLWPGGGLQVEVGRVCCRDQSWKLGA